MEVVDDVSKDDEVGQQQEYLHASAWMPNFSLLVGGVKRAPIMAEEYTMRTV
jgi:hypothetical protein